MKSKHKKSDSVSVDFKLLMNEIEESEEGEGYTTAEIAELMGCGIDKARKLVQRAMDAGKCRASRRWIKTITGHPQRYVTYVFEEGCINGSCKT